MDSLWRTLKRIYSSSPPVHGRDASNSSSQRRNSNDSSEDYELLLPNSHHPQHRRRRTSFRSKFRASLHWFTLRRFFVGLCFIPILFAIGLVLGGVPPDFEDVWTYEHNLPQHLWPANSTDLGIDDGRKFLRFPGHAWGLGLNNVLQEAIVAAHLAHLSKRTYVFEDYVWSRNSLFLPGPYTIYDGRLRPKKIPLNTFIGGALAGGRVYSSLDSPLPDQVGHGDDTRISVSADYYSMVCNDEQQIVRISTEGAPNQADGMDLLTWWVDRLAKEDAKCVEIVEDEGHRAFDWSLFGSPRFLSIYASMATSPVLRDFAWSPLVQSSLSRTWTTLKSYSNVGVLYDFLPASLSGTEAGQIEDLVAVHLRRGDYSRHCPRLAGWRVSYQGMNQHPGLPDRFDWESSVAHLKSDASQEEINKAVEDYYLLHCFPTPEQVVSALQRVRSSSPNPGKLKRVYILTNGWSWFFNRLRALLMEDGWDEVMGSIDVESNLDNMQSWVGMAVDMAVAEKAGVFVGNGFSSLSSNIIMLRMAKGADARTNRFL